MPILNRNEIKDKYKWDIERMYPDENKWELDLNKCIELSNDFLKYQGSVGKNPSALLVQLEQSSNISRLFENVIVYARQRRDEDNANPKYIEMMGKAIDAASIISSNTAFFTPELISKDEDEIMSFFKIEPRLKIYEFMLASIFKEKKHILSSKEESLLANLADIRDASSEIFTMLNNVDLDFGIVKDKKGEEFNLTHGNYTKLMESDDRDLREQVYKQMYSKYKSLNNTLSVIYSYNVKNYVTGSKIRNYDDVLSYALDSENISPEIYRNLIDVVHDHLPSMYKYIKIKKRVLGIDDLGMHDIYLPITSLEDKKCSFEEAVNLCSIALSPLGDDYVKRFKKGVLNERWVDIYENKGKTSGAYSFGSYDSYPYILMNYNNEIDDAFTLIHEGGHSMHSIYTREKQPFIYGSHSIFTAETASTVNETLLINYLIDNAKNKKEKIYWVNKYIDAFRATLFRQTMFAEFELLTHTYVEKGGQLTAQWLNKKYDELNKLYYGPNVKEDEFIRYEWSRIPHFYRPFYVYQYATGYSAANAIAKSIVGTSSKFSNDNGNYGVRAKDDYIDFLKSGNSNYPIDLLKIAGVDMNSKNSIERAMEVFDIMVDELDSLI
ncbi:oligoendopeptidase F [Alterileibacterium massiliense]|uniref:oligoendopeptidase F n=1 Tax=Alterileibacterium massiliense TaxID=1870997 RepID=UPI0008DA2BCE|nr:oligoendopeptidase F [Alterileibacterium massiliense]